LHAALSSIEGFDEVVRHFGRWPSFHDAVLEKFLLNFQGDSLMSARTWNTSSETDERGYYRTKDEATVDFVVQELLEVEIVGQDLYAGTIIFGLSVERKDASFRIRLDPCVGIGGFIERAKLRMVLRK
jgi:hypothetical protein